MGEEVLGLALGGGQGAGGQRTVLSPVESSEVGAGI